jgi:hypothetical protein
MPSRKKLKKSVRSKKSNARVSRSNKRVGGGYRMGGYRMGGYRMGGEKDDRDALCIFFIYGLGCKYMDESDNLDIQMEIANKANISEKDVKMICHDKHFAPIRGILSSFFDYVPMQNSSFLRRLKQDVLAQLLSYKKVLILGHSYGGAIANRLAEELNDDANVSSIKIATFGSIYVAHPDDVQNVSIVNYQSINDLSSKFNKNRNISYQDLTYNIQGYNILMSGKDVENVVDVCIATAENPTCAVKKKSFFGSDEEWEIHNNYFDLIFLLSSVRSNNILPSSQSFNANEKNEEPQLSQDELDGEQVERDYKQMSFKNFLQKYNIPLPASETKSGYIKLSLVVHPDRNSPDRKIYYNRLFGAIMEEMSKKGFRFTHKRRVSLKRHRSVKK